VVKKAQKRRMKVSRLKINRLIARGVVKSKKKQALENRLLLIKKRYEKLDAQLTDLEDKWNKI